MTASALGLGDIKLESALNQPFDAEIPLESVGSTDLTELKVSLASAETFTRYGLDKPAFLENFNFVVYAPPGDTPVIRISSTKAISEPFVTLLLDVKWASGRLLREYTVLLDPPVFDEATVAADVAAPVAAPAESRRQTQSAPAEPVPPAQQAAAAPAESSTQSPATEAAVAAPVSRSRPAPLADSYQAQRGDTLWRIAERARSGSGLSNNQMMLAIYRANPEAFLGNINGLKAGAILRIPPAAEAADLSASEATAEVRDQNAAWGAGTASEAVATDAVATDNAPRLQLVAPGTEDTIDEQGTSGQASGSEAALRSRVNELESQLTESQRLIQLRDAELEALQQRIAELDQSGDEFLADDAVQVTDDLADSLSDESLGQDGAIEVGDDILGEDGDVLADDIGEGLDAAEPSPFADESTESEAPVDERAAADTAGVASDVSERAPEATGEPTEESSLVGSLLGSYWLWGAVGIVLLAALVLARRRSASADADATGRWVDEADLADETAADFTDLEPVEDTFVVDEADEYDDELDDILDDELAEDSARPREIPEPDEEPEVGPLFDEEDEADPVAQTSALEPLARADAEAGPDDEPETAFEKTISTGAPLNLDQADPIAEAEFHMAYGLYDQAAELLVRALEDEPDNRAYRVKLIEVYFVWENKQGFLEQAGLLRGSVRDEADADWNKVLILGKQLCPSDELFSGEQSAFAAPGGMDLELGDAGGTELDFTLGGKDIPTLDEDSLDMSGDSADDGDVLDFDLGSALDEEEQDISLDLSDSADDEGSSGDGAVTMESPTLDIDFGADGGATMESPTLEMASTPGGTSEMPALDSDVLDDDGLDGRADFSDPTSLEVDLSGLTDLPLDELDEQNEGLGDTGSDATDDGESESDEFDIDSTLNQLDNTGELLTPEDMSRTIAGESLDDADEVADDDATMLADTSHFDMSTFDEVAGSEAAGDTVEQPGAAVADGDTAEQPEISFDLDSLDETGNVDLDAETQLAAMPGDATMTEVGTKLDLARAYIDMGDPDGARSILNEVLDEGGDAQQQEARQLLEELGD